MTPDRSWGGLLDSFGAIFLEDRYMLVPVVLIVLLVGLLEKHGLRERAAALMAGMRAATAGRVLLAYAVVRQISVALGLAIGGQASMVRPVVAPMAEAAAMARHGRLSDRIRERIRAHAAAVDNIASFFGEDVFVAVGAVLLMKGFFDGARMSVSLWKMALWGIPTAGVALAALAWRMHVLDREVARDQVPVDRPDTPQP